MALKVNIEKRKEEGFLVSLTGSLDSSTYLDYEKQMESVLKKAPKAVIFDMSGLSYISSAGFRVLFKIKQAVEKNKGSIAIANLQPDVKKIFEAVKVISESLFMTLDYEDDVLDNYIDHVIKKAREGEPHDK